MEEAKQKEKARILDAQTIISESVYSDEEDSHTEDEAESGEVSMIEGVFIYYIHRSHYEMF